MKNNSDRNSTTAETKSHEPAPKMKTGADLKDVMLDVLGGKAAEVKQSVTANVEDDKAQYHKNIAADIAEAKRHLTELPSRDMRGLEFETFQRTRIFFLPNYRHPKSPNSLPTPRFIARLGSDDDLPAYNAILTPTGRDRFKNSNRWEAQKTLTAGDKLLFYPKALEESTFFVTEGEINAASIMQATKFFVKACALGGAGIFEDLIRRLAKLKAKPHIIILFDNDKTNKKNTGKEKSLKLQKVLADRGIAAVPVFLDDFISKKQKETFDKIGKKNIDPNDILQSFGDIQLKGVIEKILEQTRADFKKAEEEIEQSINTQVTTDDKSRRENYSLEIEDLIREINTTITPADLEAHGYLRHSERGSARPDGYCCPWCGSGDGEHKTGALKFITDDGEPHFGCGKCGGGGNVISFLAHVKNLPTRGKEFFDTLKSIADKFSIPYNPKMFTTPTTKSVIAALNFPDELKNEIEEWEDINGTIDPKIFPKLDAAKKFIESLSALNFKSSFAYVPATRNKVALCKFYLPSIAQKFFDTLKNARSLSREILKKISQETAEMGKSGASIPNVDLAEINRLSEIASSKIVEEVDIIVTALKRKHKAFVARQQARQRAEAQKAAVDAYNANPAWTQKKIPDCPINLVLPDSVYFSEKEVGTQTITENGKSITHAATKSPIVPTKIFRTTKSHVTRYEVAIKSRRHWRHIIVDGEELADSRKILRLATDGGAIIKDAKALTNYFADIIAANEDQLPEVPCYTRPGWHDEKFIYPTPAADEDYRVIRSGIDYDSIFKAQGDKDAWLKKFWDIVHGKQGELKRIIIGACLLAPMLKVVRVKNPQFNLWGTSNYAKTPLPKFGLSIYGDPSEGKLMRTWGGSSKNRLTMAAGFCDLPQLLDEGETLSGKALAEKSSAIYDFHSGIINQTNKRTGNAKEAEAFRSVRFSTAEKPSLNAADKRGAYKRLIEIHVTKPLFEDNYARNLHIFCENNYGHFGRQWTKYIEANQDQIREDFDRTEKFFVDEGFTRDGIPANYSSVDATNARAVIGCAVAYWHFLMCLEIEDKFDFVEARDDAAAILAILPTVDEISDVKHSLELLASWVVENPRRFITPARVNGVEVDNMDDPADTHASTVGKKFADGRIAFFANAFRNIVAEIGLPSYEKVLCDLYDADLLDCKSSREKAKTIKVGEQSARAYVLKAGALAASTNDDD